MLCLAIPFVAAGCADRESGVTAIVTVQGESADWQNRLNRTAARLADGFGMAEHVSVRSFDDMVRQLQALCGKDDSHEIKKRIRVLKIWTHGYLGMIDLGDEALTLEQLAGVRHLAARFDREAIPPRWKARLVTHDETTRLHERFACLRNLLARSPDSLPRIEIEVCSLGLGRRGRSFLLSLSDRLGAEITCITGEHLGLKRFGSRITVRPGDTGEAWNTRLAPKADPAAARTYAALDTFAPRQYLLDHEPRPVDAYADSVIRSGEWTFATEAKGFSGSGYLVGPADDPEAAVYYLPVFATPGELSVQIHYPADSSFARNAAIEIRHAAGCETVSINQHERAAQWVDLGTYHFEAGWWNPDAAAVVIHASATGERVVADAVRFITPVADTDAYRANRKAIDTVIGDGDMLPADRNLVREIMVGDAVGFPLADPAYGKVYAPLLREDRRSAASKAWRSGFLNRFSEDLDASEGASR